MKQNIVHLTTVHIRTDTRILYKEVQSLSKKYKTTLIVADGKGNSVNENVEILDLGKPKNRIFRILFYGLKAMATIKKRNISCIHIHDPELIMISLLLKIRGYKVIYDIHELVYEDIRTKGWISSKIIKNCIAWIYKKLEKMAMKFFDGIVLAEDGYKEYFEKNYKEFNNKIEYVRNYPIKKMFINSNKEFPFPSGKENNLIYLGAISRDRGILELVNAMKFLDETFKLFILGKWNDDALLNECKKSEGWTKVDNIGYVKPDKISMYIQQSKLGMCTLHKIENFAYTTPVKSFEYLINGVPLVMTDFEYWEKFYHGASIFVNPYNSKEVAKKIKTLVLDNNKIDDMAKKGYELANKHCWENEEIRLFKLYKKVLS